MVLQGSVSSPINRSMSDVGCYYHNVGLYIIPSYTVVWSFFLLPLGFLVSHAGFQTRQQNKRSPVSHTDFFTYHTLFLEMVRYCGSVIYSVGSLISNNDMILWGFRLRTFSFPGLLSYHVLICIERYLAVVFPVVYLSLRKHKWIWLRKYIIAVVWPLGALWVVMLKILKRGSFYIPNLVAQGLAFCIITFCSVHVLHKLRNPRPGEGGGVSQTKRRAFNTILVILFALWLWLDEGIVKIVIKKADVLKPHMACQLEKSTCWFELASSLVLPLLFLQRNGKLLSFKRNK